MKETWPQAGRILANTAREIGYWSIPSRYISAWWVAPLPITDIISIAGTVKTYQSIGNGEFFPAAVWAVVAGSTAMYSTLIRLCDYVDASDN